MKTRLLIMGLVIGLLVLFGVNSVHGLWIPRSAQELLEQSQTIFVGNITGIKAVQVEAFTKYEMEENGVLKTMIENYTITLEDYDVTIEDFLKSPILFTKHVYQQAGMRENLYDTFSVLVSAELITMSPLKQYNAGVPSVHIVCNAGFEVLIRPNNQFGGCFNSASVSDMVKRGWGSPFNGQGTFQTD